MRREIKVLDLNSCTFFLHLLATQKMGLVYCLSLPLEVKFLEILDLSVMFIQSLAPKKGSSMEYVLNNYLLSK